MDLVGWADRAVVEIAVGARLVICCVLISAAIFKIRRSAQTRDFILEIGVPSRFISATYIGAVVAEVSVGLLFGLGLHRIAGLGGIVLFSAFSWIIVRTRESQKPCACLGRDSDAQSLKRRLAPRVAGIAASAVIFVVPATSEMPSVTAFLLAVLPSAWIIRPQALRLIPGDEDAQPARTDEIGRGEQDTDSEDQDSMGRRAALRRVASVAAAGALVPATRFGNLLGLNCCYPPCKTTEYCYASGTGNCSCLPRPAKPVMDTVPAIIGEPEEPPTADCQATKEGCEEGCPQGDDCTSTCGFNCNLFAPPTCSVAMFLYMECMATCLRKVDTCYANCLARYYSCCMDKPTDPACSRSAPPTSLIQAALARKMGEQHGVWAERAWAFKYLYSQSFVVTTFAGMAGSPLFGELKNRQKRFVRGTLEKRSELLISTGVNLREELSDGFTKDLAARALQIGKHGLRAVSEEPTNPVMGLDHPGEDVFSIDNSKVSLSAEKIDITEMRRRINASITQIDKDKRFVDTLGLESGSLPRVVTDEWRRDAQKILAALGK